MKTALVTFRSDKMPFGRYENRIIDEFKTCGYKIDALFVMPKEGGELKDKLSDARDLYDNMIIAAPTDSGLVKAAVMEIFGKETVLNSNAFQFITDYLARFGLHPTEIAEDLAMLPEGSTLIPNPNGIFQGYMLEENEFSLVVLPAAIDEAVDMCVSYVLPYFESKYRIRYNNTVLKFCDASQKEIDDALRQAAYIGEGALEISSSSSFGDYKIELTYKDSADKTAVDDTVRFLLTALEEYSYAEASISLEQRLFDHLKLKNIKISTAESFTGGNVARRIVSVSGASEVFSEGIVAYSNESKCDRLGVSEKTIKEYGAVSEETAYEMAAGLLKTSICDVAIATTGIAGPKSDGTDKPVGLCYFAIGTASDINVFKYELKGDREAITETGVNIALFQAIKRIKTLT